MASASPLPTKASPATHSAQQQPVHSRHVWTCQLLISEDCIRLTETETEFVIVHARTKLHQQARSIILQICFLVVTRRSWGSDLAACSRHEATYISQSLFLQSELWRNGVCCVCLICIQKMSAHAEPEFREASPVERDPGRSSFFRDTSYHQRATNSDKCVV
jgi:hypothetical protein